MGNESLLRFDKSADTRREFIELLNASDLSAGVGNAIPKRRYVCIHQEVRLDSIKSFQPALREWIRKS